MLNVVDRKAELGFSFHFPSEYAVEAIFALEKFRLEQVPTLYFTPGDTKAGVEITGECYKEQDILVAHAVLEASQKIGGINLIRSTVITFEDLSKRKLLKDGGVRTVVHQIAIRSLIQGIEED